MNRPFCISEHKKKEGKYCCAFNCKNTPVSKKGGLCHAHYRRKRKVIDPVYDRYNSFKTSAKQRGKEFNISLKEFRAFCQETGYVINKGYRGKVASVDRVINSLGYSIDNIQMLSIRANINKYHQEDRFADVPF